MPTDLTIREYDVADHLGRHMVLDPRSLAYRRPYDGRPLRATAWEPRLPVLDQTNLIAQGIRTTQHGLDQDVDALASCTGNAATALLSIILSPQRAAAAGLETDNATAAEHFAIGLYADATAVDQWQDLVWPSQDCGSSGLGIAKTLRNRGLIDQYGHATTAEELCTLLQTGPVLMGLSWHAAFSAPDNALVARCAAPRLVQSSCTQPRSRPPGRYRGTYTATGRGDDPATIRAFKPPSCTISDATRSTFARDAASNPDRPPTRTRTASIGSRPRNSDA